MDAQESSGGSYYDSLNRSMALTLDEFYSTLNRCGVSAATGDGVDEFLALCEKARAEYFEEYWKDLNDRREAVKELKEQVRRGSGLRGINQEPISILTTQRAASGGEG